MGRIPSALFLEQISEAKEIAGKLKEIFPGRFYLEVWNHFLKPRSCYIQTPIGIIRFNGNTVGGDK